MRQEVFELMVRRRARDRDALDQIFDDLLKLRVLIAKNAGFENYRDYVFKRYERFDYKPADCEAFHTAVAKFIVPLARKIQEDRKRELELDQLRPWDLAVDPKNRPPLRPFQKVDELIGTTQAIFDNLDPELGRDFALMREKQLLDLANRKGKAPGGYQNTLQEARVPFIFMNAVGIHRDVETLLHESGHAFHALAARNQPLNEYRHAPIEFCEVASMGMELLAAGGLSKFYSPEDTRRAKLNHLKDIIGLFPWIAQVDAFQHWIYLNPGHTREQRTQTWLGLTTRFGGIEDWSDYEFSRETLWHKQLHIFEVPFYYIEYGIAQLGALQLWRNFQRDEQSTLRRYKEALRLGGSRPLPELFEAAGAKFDFSEATIRPLIDAVREEYESLSRQA
jgi:oligoendopeptidase F